MCLLQVLGVGILGHLLPCDLDLTSEVAAACGGRARCSLLADLVTVAILSGELQGERGGLAQSFLHFRGR